MSLKGKNLFSKKKFVYAFFFLVRNERGSEEEEVPPTIAGTSASSPTKTKAIQVVGASASSLRQGVSE